MECLQIRLVVVTAGGGFWWQLAEFEHTFFVVACVTVGMTELVVGGALDIGLCWGVELLGRGVLELGPGLLDEELELELEIVPLRGACELDNEGLDVVEPDGVDVVLKIWLLDPELILELELKDGLGLGDGPGDGLGDELELGDGLGLGGGVGLWLEEELEELELEVTVVENWTWLIGEEKVEVVVVEVVVVTVVEGVVVVGNGIEEDGELEEEELCGLELVVVVLVVVLVVVVVVLVVTSG